MNIITTKTDPENYSLSLLPLLLLVLLLASCSFDYKEAMVEESSAEKTPESIMFNISQIVVRDGNPTLRVEAERAEIYDGNSLVSAYNIHFMEYGESGDILSEGWADRILYYSDTENAEFKGSINLYSTKEKTSISTEDLKWESSDQILSTPPETSVILKKDDGSVLEGRGFEANLSRREIQFKSEVKGVYIVTEEEEEELPQ